VQVIFLQKVISLQGYSPRSPKPTLNFPTLNLQHLTSHAEPRTPHSAPDIWHLEPRATSHIESRNLRATEGAVFFLLDFKPPSPTSAI
jgi:hypothetical protein